MEFRDKKIDLDTIDSYWYRRGDFNFEIRLCQTIQNHHFIKDIENNLQTELHSIKKFLHFLLSTKKGINNKISSESNKLVNLLMASELGLTIPNSVICQNKEIITKELQEQILITKAIGETLHFYSDLASIMAYTEEITQLENFTFPSLFQEKLDKKLDIRTFFLNDYFYSMAIFSQNDTKTQTDFRNYNHLRPNRSVPFKLPLDIEQKLSTLAEKIGINSGSFDIVLTKNNEYVFLEVNPVGQFGMVSIPCNYELEYLIADYL